MKKEMRIQWLNRIGTVSSFNDLSVVLEGDNCLYKKYEIKGGRLASTQSSLAHMEYDLEMELFLPNHEKYSMFPGSVPHLKTIVSQS